MCNSCLQVALLPQAIPAAVIHPLRLFIEAADHWGYLQSGTSKCLSEHLPLPKWMWSILGGYCKPESTALHSNPMLTPE